VGDRIEQCSMCGSLNTTALNKDGTRYDLRSRATPACGTRSNATNAGIAGCSHSSRFGRLPMQFANHTASVCRKWNGRTEGMIDSERVQKAARELIDYARTFLSTAYPNRTRELVDALDAALTADPQPVGDAPNVGDDCCPECHCLKSAHHGPLIGCEGSGGNCGRPDTFPPPHPAAPEPLVYKDADAPTVSLYSLEQIHETIRDVMLFGTYGINEKRDLIERVRARLRARRVTDAELDKGTFGWEQIEAALKPAYIATFDTEMQYDQMLRNLHKLLTARERVTVEDIARRKCEVCHSDMNALGFEAEGLGRVIFQCDKCGHQSFGATRTEWRRFIDSERQELAQHKEQK
jgi:hypothetical protein